MRAGGVDPDTFPVIVGKPERGSEPAGIVVLGVPVGNEEFLEQYANSKTGDAGKGPYLAANMLQPPKLVMSARSMPTILVT